MFNQCYFSGLEADPILPVPVLMQITSPGGIPGDEVTIAAALAAADYTTAIVGKTVVVYICKVTVECMLLS